MRMHNQRGSAATELTLVTPLLLVFLLFVVAGGRFVGARLDVDNAAASAARAASIARDSNAATLDAQTSAQATLGAHGITCRSLDVNVDTVAFLPGGWVGVDVTCSIDISDLALLQFPGTQTVHSRFVAAIDAYRGGP